MGVRSAKDAIREARIKAGLTQEQLSEGICSLQALSRIETGTSGVSPATFQALMEHAGAPCGQFPIFADKNDFKCFHALKLARFHLDAWQLAPAYNELQKLEALNWACNKLYFQEWLFLHCRLQFSSYCCDHQQNFDTLMDALRITRPDIDLYDFRRLLLSQTEIRILTMLAQEFLYLNQPEACLKIHVQIDGYLSLSKFTAMETERLQAEDAIVYTKYLIARGNYDAAIQAADASRHKMAVNIDAAPLFELTFLVGLCHYYISPDPAAVCIKAAFYSAYAVESSYATACRNYLIAHTDFPIPDYMKSLPDIPLSGFPTKKMTDITGFTDGIYNANAAGLYTLGTLIQDLRLEQHVSQSMLCYGLCSNSKLSKIENGALLPDIPLAEALLQRLGMSERIFTFWGTEKDAKFYDLKYKIIHKQNMSKEKIDGYLNEMKQLISHKDTLYYQEYLVDKAFQKNTPWEKIDMLTKALALTLPDFDIFQIHNFRLSWQELSILNNIAHQYRLTDNAHLCNLYFLQIIEYVNDTKLDIMLQTFFLPHTNYMYCHSLYAQKIFKGIQTLPSHINMSIMKYDLNMYGAFLFYYCQALGECSLFEDAATSAMQACALNDLMELYPNASALIQYIKDDFSIVSKY